MATNKKPSYKHKKLATFSFFSILILVVGVALSILYLAMFRGKDDIGAKILMWAGIVMTAVGFIFTLICIIAFRIADLRDKKHKDDDNTKEEEADPSTETRMVGGTYIFDSSNVTYVPSKEAYDFVVVGQYQTFDQKFEEIGRMDKTQFVIYIARLFSRKGFQVKLTPVVDNHDIDLLVEKSGVTIAIGCILTNKVLCKEDIVCVKNGRSFYGVNNSMALTNMYFDRSALDYAKQEHMSLVDRNILAEDFMS